VEQYIKIFVKFKINNYLYIMSDLSKHIDKNLALPLPENITVDDLMMAGDIIIGESLVSLRNLIKSNEDPSLTIKAFNSIVGMQKYLLARKSSMVKQDELMDDLGDVINEVE